MGSFLCTVHCHNNLFFLLFFHNTAQWLLRSKNLSLLATPPRVPSSSRPVAPSSTPLRPAVPTRSAPTFTVSSAVRLVPPRATPTPTPTSRPVLSGTRTLCSPTSRTPRSSFPVPRWPSLVSRRPRSATTSSPTSRKAPHKRPDVLFNSPAFFSVSPHRSLGLWRPWGDHRVSHGTGPVFLLQFP